MKLTRFEKRQAAALCEAILPPGGARLPYGADDVDAVGHLERLLPRLPLRTALGLRLILFALTLSPLWRRGRPHTFAALGQTDGATLLEGLMRSPNYFLRQMVFAIRELACMAYGADARVRQAIDQAAPRTTGGTR